MTTREIKRSPEVNSNSAGFLFVLTGVSGAGKDTVFDELLKHPEIVKFGFSRVVTHATRKPRPGEMHGITYHFVSKQQLISMHKSGELVEEPVWTDLTYKATSKRELEEIIVGQNKIWRIEMERAGDVASGNFFDRYFGDRSDTFKQRSLVVVITANYDEVVERRRRRDKDRYDQATYDMRDEAENKAFEKYREHFVHQIENREGELNKTVETIVKLITSKISIQG